MRNIGGNVCVCGDGGGGGGRQSWEGGSVKERSGLLMSLLIVCVSVFAFGCLSVVFVLTSV